VSKIKVAELFYSIQGEGKYMGTPSVFLRTFGCNFRCEGFSMRPSERSTERHNVDPSKYSRYEDLPLVNTGCDSYASWDPRFKHLSPEITISDIAKKTRSLLPKGKFGSDVHLVITGGEPLLGWQKAYSELFNEFSLLDMDLRFVTFETNGTQMLQESFKDYLSSDEVNITFSVSAKLPSSGEQFSSAIKPEVVYNYIAYGNVYFKFVVSSPNDYVDVKRALDKYHEYSGMKYIPVYLMPAGGTVEEYEKNKKWVADLCMKEGYRYSPRLHVDLFGNSWGT